MRIQKTDVIGGLPASIARDFVRAYYHQADAWRGRAVLEKAGISDAPGVFAALVAEGYLERGSAATDTYPTFEATLLGNALGMASFGKPIARKTAEALIDGLLSRARMLNADPEQLHSVARIRVFGSYLDPDVDPLGDVDVEISIARRAPVEVIINYGREADKSFGSYLEMITWSEREFKQKLRNRSVALNITTEDVERFTLNVRTVYDIAEDSNACPIPSTGAPTVVGSE